MFSDVMNIVLNMIQIVILLFAAGFAIERLKRKKASVMLVFFIYGVICWLLSDIYWLAMDVMLPDKRIRFGVNEIAEAGVFLLFATLTTIVSRMVENKGALITQVLSLLYSVLIIGLWIAWNGEVAKDILSGIAFMVLICSCVNAMQVTGALSKKQWAVLCILSFTVCILQYVIFVVPSGLAKVLDITCYILMGINMLFVLVVSVRSAIASKNEGNLSKSAPAFTLSVLCFIISTSNMYMSAEAVYPFSFAAVSLSIPLMVYTVLLVGDLETGSIMQSKKQGGIL